MLIQKDLSARKPAQCIFNGRWLERMETNLIHVEWGSVWIVTSKIKWKMHGDCLKLCKIVNLSISTRIRMFLLLHRRNITPTSIKIFEVDRNQPDNDWRKIIVRFPQNFLHKKKNTKRETWFYQPKWIIASCSIILITGTLTLEISPRLKNWNSVRRTTVPYWR